MRFFIERKMTMREILFKAKSIDGSGYYYVGEWVEGYYVKSFCIHETEPCSYIFPLDNEMDWFDGFYTCCLIDDETLCQFTGLYDSTEWGELSKEEQTRWLETHTAEEWVGRKIYEGDILKNKNGHIGVVVFESGRFIKKCDCHPLSIGELWGENEKVIGNIHEDK